MVKSLKNAAIGLVLFAILTALVVLAQNGIRDAYNLEDLDKRVVSGSNVTIGQAFDNLDIVQGMNRTMTAAYAITAPSSATGSGDILGSLAAAAIGAVQIIAGLLTTPFQIAFILHAFYNIPTMITFGIITILTISIGFIILKMFTGGGEI